MRLAVRAPDFGLSAVQDLRRYLGTATCGSRTLGRADPFLTWCDDYAREDGLAVSRIASPLARHPITGDNRVALQGIAKLAMELNVQHFPCSGVN